METKKVAIFAIGATVYSLATAGLVFAALHYHQPWKVDSNLQLPKAELTAQAQGPIDYYPIDKQVISIKGERNRSHILMLEITIASRQAEKMEFLEASMPLIKNALLFQFGDLSYEDLVNNHNVTSLQGLVKDAVVRAAGDKQKVIDDVFLTKYIIQ